MTNQSVDLYKSLYRLGGAAALIVVILTFADIVALVLFPQPVSIEGWFALFHQNRIVGLLDFWGLEIPMYWMFAVVFAALYAALHKTDPGWMAVAAIAALVGVGVFLATNNPFTMATLSDRYAAASTEAQRSALVGAGQMALANTNQRAVGGFNMGLFLVLSAGLIASLVMWRGAAFSRSTALVGILANALSLADYLREALTADTLIALVVILSGALLTVAWYIRLGMEFRKLARRD